jgi:glycerol-3-phosphate cytidylyltransferase-like family protein
VDDVLFGASYQITQEMISSLHINTVVVVVDEKGQNSGLMKNGPDPLAVATAQGLVKKITVNHKITGKISDYFFSFI